MRALCEGGTMEFLPWTGASVIAQVGYGALVCKIFGFSFEVLRASSQTLGAAADIGVFLLARSLRVRAGLALLVALSFALSPVRVNLGFTFMTDLPFTAFVVWAAYFYVKGLRSGSTRWLLWGSLLAVIATLIRQHGVFVAAAASFAALTLRSRYAPAERAALGERLRAGIVCSAGPALAIVAYYTWLFLVQGTPEAMARKADEAFGLDPLMLGNLSFRALEYLGILLLPLSAVAFVVTARRRPRVLLFATFMLSVLVGFLFWREGAHMPYLPNLIYDFGVGALTLRDTLFLGLPSPDSAGAAFHWPLTVLATLSAAVTVVTIFETAKRPGNTPTIFAILAFGLLFAGSLLHARFYFDRYLLPILPFAGILTALGVAALSERARDAGYTFAAIAALLVSAWFSIAGTHDYMEWNRARYGLLAELSEAGVAPNRIDGGMEFNAWHLAKTVNRSPTNADVVVGQDAKTKSWWWVVDDEYVVSMQPLAGYRVHRQRFYKRWLSPGEAAVYTLDRTRTTDGKSVLPPGDSE